MFTRAREAQATVKKILLELKEKFSVFIFYLSPRCVTA